MRKSFNMVLRIIFATIIERKEVEKTILPMAVPRLSTLCLEPVISVVALLEAKNRQVRVIYLFIYLFIYYYFFFFFFFFISFFFF
jgi:hypothetical protein